MKTTALLVAALIAVPCLLAAALIDDPLAAQSGRPASAAPLGKGYLDPADEPNSLVLVAPPPAPRSPALALDRAIARKALGQAGGPRWNLARSDAELRLPLALKAFSCSAGVRLEAIRAPRLMALMTKSQADIASSTYAAKMHYRRTRPFVENRRPTCTPEREANQRNDGSYPSGHAAIGWGWALILAELLPERSDQIFARGRAFGDSRLACNVHWLSDTEEGRLLGAATIAKLHTNAGFAEDLRAAREELSGAGNAAAPDPAGCAAEAGALGRNRE